MYKKLIERLRNASLWIEKHGRNTNSAIGDICMEAAIALESIQTLYGFCDGCSGNTGEVYPCGSLFCNRLDRPVHRADQCTMFQIRKYPEGYDMSSVPKMYVKISNGVPVAYRYGYDYEQAALLADGGYKTQEEAINAFYSVRGNRYNTLEITNAVDYLNYYRNQHYADSSNTESYKLADAINTLLPVFTEMQEKLK